MNGNGKLKESKPETEVIATAQRRQYSREYKERILAEIDGAREPGEVGAILRREGLYTQLVSKWRAQRKDGFPGTGKRGPQANSQASEIARLKRENERLRAKLERAETILEVQKKSRCCLGWKSPRKRSGSEGGGGRAAREDRGEGGLPGPGTAAQSVLSEAAAGGSRPSQVRASAEL